MPSAAEISLLSAAVELILQTLAYGLCNFAQVNDVVTYIHIQFPGVFLVLAVVSTSILV